MATPNSIESIKANIAARKAREAQEAKERAENGGKTLAELSAARVQAHKELLASVEQANFRRDWEAFDAQMSAIERAFDKLPFTRKSPEQVRQEAEEAARLHALQLKAEQRAIGTFGKF
jgi:hypothetical protein